jgi:c-di-GMP-binding flagellar brake protein YcgR
MASIYNVGSKVDLRLVKNVETSNGIEKNYRTYKSKIFDILDDKQLKLAMPIEGRNVILLPLEETFEIFFYTPNGLYQAKGKVVSRLKENKLFTMIFELTTGIEKNQRREYFRYNCTIDVKYCPLTDYESTLMVEEEIEEVRGKRLDWKKGIIVDISGGGVRFTSGDEFSKGSYVMCKFTITYKRPRELCTIVKIIASEKKENRSDVYENRAMYITMSPDETEEIVRYIFEEERKSQKNRKS